jgi:hypothetical protein
MQFKTRRELHAFLKSEAADMREAYGHGGTAVEIAGTAAYAWKHRKKGWRYDLAISFGRSRARSDRPFGLFLGHATRRDYLQYLKEEQF